MEPEHDHPLTMNPRLTRRLMLSRTMQLAGLVEPKLPTG